MSMSKHSVQPFVQADVPTQANFLVAAKLQLSINRFLFKDWPNEPAQRAMYTDAAKGNFEGAENTCLKIVNDASGDMVGYIVITHRPAGKPLFAKNDPNANQEQQPSTPEGFNPEVLPTVVKMIEDVHKEMNGIEHIRSFAHFSESLSLRLTTRITDITHLYVQPSSRRQGLASMLVQRSFDMAKAAGLPLVVGTEPAAHDFFLSRGFKDSRHFDVDLSKWAPPYCGWGIFRFSGMIYSPQALPTKLVEVTDSR
jgi:GNAT superfamily N-acetyltransferase